ncbi:hypothetical protein [Adhaeribacter aquaticus]|uniref:hypothetical protein n=1 Tax=Adhaeribacter aquaticus TaxID=299567 RepID=UPI0004228315|nr:hypothetical protein [Adhaeribacter aquaticus]
MLSNADNLYEDSIVQIFNYKELSILKLVFKKQPEPEQFRNGYLLAFDAVSRKNIKFWVTDASNIKTMLPDNQNWLMQNMMPFLSSNRIQKFAIIISPECFVMTNPNRVYEKNNEESKAKPVGKIKIHFDEEAALNWIYQEEMAG